MLVNFRVMNFMSIDSLNEFSMIIGNVRKHNDWVIKRDKFSVLKFAAIYGANASGKSNFVQALKVSKDIIINGLDEYDLSRVCNLNNSENINGSMSFEYEILLNSNVFSYGFSLNPRTNSISKEWLYEITNTETYIFTREKTIDINFSYLNIDEAYKNRLQVYADDISNSESTLFLSFLNKYISKEKNESETTFTAVFNWFRDNLEVISPDEAPSDFGITYTKEEYLCKLTDFLKSNDTGITNVFFEETSGRLKGIPIEIEKKILDKIRKDLSGGKKGERKDQGVILRTNDNIFRIRLRNDNLETSAIKFYHDSEDTSFSISEESDGTRRLIELFSVVANTKKDKVFIVDEIDRSLHPLLTLNFILSFKEKSNDNQLIVTTHEDRLLDLNLIRRDQIWFVKKDKDRNSQLYSLEEFKERFDKNIMNAYLDGRYGATPKLNSFFININEDGMVV